MKLFYSPTSPYVRKVMACAVALDLDQQIERVTTNPWDSGAELLAQNPLSKVPCLVTDDGLALFDSPVICEYLDYLGRGTLFPPAGASRWRALKAQAIADGMTDAAILRRLDAARPAEPARAAAMDRQRLAVGRGLDALEAEPPPDHVDIGTISVGCALGYLDFRFAAQPWRPGRPKLERWFETIRHRRELADTAPPPA
jgi:glutathione S-transferase